MRISSIQVQEFKRFTDLTIDGIPASARLVVLLGANGSGKSSVLEAINTWRRGFLGTGISTWEAKNYYWKTKAPIHLEHAPGKSIVVCTNLGESITKDQATRDIAVRSAFRNDPGSSEHRDFYIGSGQQEGILTKVIDSDPLATRNLVRLLSQTIDALYGGKFSGRSADDVVEYCISEVREALSRLVPDLRFLGLKDPLTTKTFLFGKGPVEDFDYMNLSGGEKAAFDLLLDLAIRAKVSSELVYCVDEPEAHLNPRIQGQFLDELLGLLPTDGQLWIGTHSAGMMNRARELQKQDPQSVVFLSFYDQDFEKRAHISPQVVSRALWRQLLEDSLGDIAKLVAPKLVVLCEGTPAQQPGKSGLDQECLERIFRDQRPDVAFMSVGNDHDVRRDSLKFGPAVMALIEGVKISKLVDRDDRTPEEIHRLRDQGTLVLGERHLESYLFSEEILEKFALKYAGQDKQAIALKIRSEEIDASTKRGNPPDDVKSASGSIFARLKKELGLTGIGNTRDAFMRDVLAPLVTPETKTYGNLETSIFVQ